MAFGREFLRLEPANSNNAFRIGPDGHEIHDEDEDEALHEETKKPEFPD